MTVCCRLDDGELTSRPLRIAALCMEKQDAEEVDGIEGLPLWKHDIIVITAGNKYCIQ